MATADIMQDHRTHPQHRLVGGALLVSAILHLLVLNTLDPFWNRAATPAEAAPPAIELSLRRPAPATAPAEVSEPPVVPAPAPVVRTLPAEPAPNQRPEPKTRLRIDLSDLVPPEAVSSGGATDNGAVVMRGELLSLLQDAPRHTGYRAEREPEASGEFQAGSWVEFIRDGDRCFRVVRADPLDSTSQEVWYRTSCP